MIRQESVWYFLVVAGCLFRVWFIFAVRHPSDWLYSDSWRHWDNGKNFLSPGVMGAANPVLYQLWLFLVQKATGEDWFLLGLSNALLSLLFVLFWHLFIAEIFRSRKVVLFATALLAWYPSLVIVFSYYLTETLLIPLVGAGCWATWRMARVRSLPSYGLMVFFWILAILTRPVVLPFLLFGMIWGLCRLKKGRRIFALPLALLLITPSFYAAGLHGYSHYHAISPFGNDGKLVMLYFLSGKRAYIVSYKHLPGTAYGFESPAFNINLLEPFGDWTPSREGHFDFSVDRDQGGKDLSKLIWEQLKQNIEQYPNWVADNLIILMLSPQWPGTNYGEYRFERFGAYERFLWPLIFLLCILACSTSLVLKKSRNPLAIFFLFTLAAMTSACFLTVLEGRYRKPFEPLLVLSAVWVLTSLRDGFPQEILARDNSSMSKKRLLFSLFPLFVFLEAASRFFVPSGDGFWRKLSFLPHSEKTVLIKKEGEPKKKTVLFAGNSTLGAAPFQSYFTVANLVTSQLNSSYPKSGLVPEIVAHGGGGLFGEFDSLIAALKKDPALLLLSVGDEDIAPHAQGIPHCHLSSPLLPGIFRESHFLRLLALKLVRGMSIEVERSEAPKEICPEAEIETRNAFRRLLDSLLEYTKRQQIPVLLLIPPSNREGLSPNGSRFLGKNENDVLLFREFLLCARNLLRAGKRVEADEELRKSEKLFPNSSEVAYLRGELELGWNEQENAAEYFQFAQDFDVAPQRIQAPERALLRKEAADFGLPLLDANTLLLQSFPNERLNNALFQDFRHPTLKGYAALGNRLTQEIIDRNLLRLGEAENFPIWDGQRIAVETRMSNGDWFRVLYRELKTLEYVASGEERSESQVRLLLQYRRMLKELDSSYYDRVINKDGKESLLVKRLQRLSRASAECGGVVEEPDHPEGPNFGEEFLNFREVSPVHISGIPSVMKQHWDGFCEDGRAVRGGELRVYGQVYKTGFAAHPGDDLPSEVVFHLDKPHYAFSTLVAATDDGDERTSFICKIFADGVELAATPLMSAGLKLFPLQLQLPQNTKELRLHCNDSGNLARADHAAWLNSELKEIPQTPE